ncbi:glycerol kinase GlpK [Halapricum desulfuricans]|uniref:Glycerol kinase n=1 Tax=Halapricum desulfuricans TaxID=2841257 RepID=A0A897NXX4_9EURY|nr:glycerol kinase GlpK [Halapricum desulfuricans]QSG16415.1 Glycerol kinase [Halapricum desulfuricans]
MTYIGSVDQGTAATKFHVFDETGALMADAAQDHEQIYPEPGWVEHDPIEIWENTKAVITEVLDAEGIDAAELAAIGITNQRETTIVWDRETGKPVYNAIVWQDKRPTDRIDELVEAGWEEKIRETTGLEPDPFFSAGEIEWILKNVDGVQERAEAGELLFGNIDTWLAWNLTGEHVTDVSNASRTMLFDIHDLEWDDDLLAEFGVPEVMLPDVRPSIDEEYHGVTDPEGFLGVEVPVAGMMGDQQAALFGQARFEPGQIKHTIGTSCVMQMNIGTDATISEHGLNTTLAYQQTGEQPRYALEGEIFTGGQVIEWLVELGVLEDVAQSDELARSVESTGDVYVVPTFQGIATPYWDPKARGAILGLERGTSPEILVRAAFDSIAYRARDAVDAMKADSGLDIDRIRIDGGMSINNFLCERIADVTRTSVDRPVVRETTALGAAYAAGLAVGVWPDTDAIRDQWKLERSFDPVSDAETIDTEYEQWQKAIELTREWP